LLIKEISLTAVAPFKFPGPLSGTSDDEKLHKLEKEKKAFGSHDIHSHKVIGNLKKVTIALEGGEGDEDNGRGEEGEGGGKDRKEEAMKGEGRKWGSRER
jgi:hypothetical protein